ncbi:peptidoglycan DD-metalloendopeptidase family protein [Zoogloea sp.]|uniref:peptidoglycan DD-metalloendopeptidase family protein n=1 Tax=Zoogloea sp. TaxID=49181 RepID=UPI0026030E35|nr:peptidoglycan DD-metalloendopeptidase family protein [Zoogloea sp.]MDD3352504.1 peptidoglycan DD-metalloendopeptidase family protein [Zoogloea sp.]
MVRPVRRILSALLLALLPATLLAQVRPQPVPGGVAALLVAPAEAPRPEVRFDGRPVLLEHGPEGWRALVGLSLDTPAGEQSLQIGSGSAARQLSFAVLPKAYPEQHLTVKNPKMVTPDPDMLSRIQAEREVQIAVRSRFRDMAVPRTDLELPASGRLSSRFGLRRIFNGEPRAPHTGLDVAAPIGAPVRAPADGIVSLVEEFYFNGKTVFVDHGQGLVSMVCHLDASTVEVGQDVRRGEQIGRVGNTGRTTGPHLHWSVYLNGAAVDPALFIAPPRPPASRP